MVLVQGHPPGRYRLEEVHEEFCMLWSDGHLWSVWSWPEVGRECVKKLIICIHRKTELKLYGRLIICIYIKTDLELYGRPIICIYIKTDLELYGRLIICIYIKQS